MFNLEDEVQILDSLYYRTDANDYVNAQHCCGTVILIKGTINDGVRYNVQLNNSHVIVFNLSDDQLELVKEKAMFNIGDKVKIVSFSGKDRNIVGKIGEITYTLKSLLSEDIVAYAVDVPDYGSFKLTEDEIVLYQEDAKTSLTIEQIRQRSRQLEYDVLALFQAFEDETQTHIMNIDQKSVEFGTVKRTVSIRIEITL